MFVIYPNPSSTELKIGYKTDEKASANKGTGSVAKTNFSIKLLNEKGKVLKEERTTVGNKEMVLPVADIPNGIYYLHIYHGKKVSKQQVVIAH